MNRSQLFRLSVLTFGFALLSFASSARAEDPDKPRDQQRILRFTAEEGENKEGIVVQIGGPSEYWIGVVVEPLDEEDRAEAKLAKGQGFEIERVIEKSPAARAGLREDDIVFSVDGQGTGSLAELQELVAESEGKSLSFDVLRNGKKTTVKVTPSKRAEAQRIAIAEEGEEGEENEKEENEQGEGKPMVIELRKLMAGEQRPGQWQIVPGSPAWSVHPATFPEDLSVAIKKKGSKPARIKVTRGIQSWTVKENEVDQLPPEIRGYVLHMMSGLGVPQGISGMPGQPGMMMGMPQPGAGMMPGQPLGLRGGQPGGPNPNAKLVPNPAEQTQRRLEELSRRLHEENNERQERNRQLRSRLESQLERLRSRESD